MSKVIPPSPGQQRHANKVTHRAADGKFKSPPPKSGGKIAPKDPSGKWNVPLTGLASTGANSIVALPAVPGSAPGGLVAAIYISPAEGNTADIHVIDPASGPVLKTLPPLPASVRVQNSRK